MITYYTINKGTKPHKYNKVACFSDLWNKDMPDKIRYMPEPCVSDPRIVRWYVEFLHKVLPKMFSSKVITNKEGISKVLFVLKSKGMHYKLAMMYLTWFRYIHEFKPLIEEAFKYRELPLNKMFEKFIDINYEKNPNSNHALVSSYYRHKPNPCSLEKFHDNLENKPQSTEVFGYFI